MSGGWPEFIRVLLTVACIGVVIQWMDDIFDVERDIGAGERRFAVRLGRHVLPYSVILALTAAMLDWRLAVAIFLGAFSVGMFGSWKGTSSGIVRWLELFGAVILSVYGVGWFLSGWALSIVIFLDVLDDVIDLRHDERLGAPNIAVHIGVPMSMLLALAALCASFFVSVEWTVAVLTVLPLLTLFTEWSTDYIGPPS
jgi:4-hydroxybenzoate polyprenyltransferase